jgi:hypothetical protein
VTQPLKPIYKVRKTVSKFAFTNFNVLRRYAEGKELYWHSSAHVLGEALELEYGADLTIGPSIEEVGLSLPGVRFDAWTILAVINCNWCFDCKITW